MLIDPHPEILTGFEPIHLGAERHVLFGKLPKPLLYSVLDDLWFERLSDQHPAEYHEILMHGRWVRTTRWQVAYGRDYQYTRTVNAAAPVTAEIEPFLSWAQSTIAPSLNGALVNFYDGSLRHYIGPHRDSTKDLNPAAPIVIVSTGVARILRFRCWLGDGRKWDVLFETGSVLILPFQTNLGFTHEISASKRLTGRRISMTFRAFAS